MAGNSVGLTSTVPCRANATWNSPAEVLGDQTTLPGGKPRNRDAAASARASASINRSTARSDEQLAYYVAQAREVIDLSITSQQGLFENLRQLQGKHGKVAAMADGARQ